MDAWRAGTYLVLYQLTRGESAQTTDGSRLVFHQMKEEEGPFKLHLLRDAQYKGSFQLRRSVQREEGAREEQTGRKREREQGSGAWFWRRFIIVLCGCPAAGLRCWQLLRGKLPAERQAAQDAEFRLKFKSKSQNKRLDVKMFHFLAPEWCQMRQVCRSGSFSRLPSAHRPSQTIF